MSFFKKIGRSISGAFKKAPGAISSFFKKTVPYIAGKVGGGLSKVGDVLGKVADVGSTVLNNPLVQLGGSALLGPEFGIAANLAGKGLDFVRKGSQLAQGASGLAGIVGSTSGELGSGNLGGTVAGVQRGIQKAKDLREQAGVAGPAFQFA